MASLNSSPDVGTCPMTAPASACAAGTTADPPPPRRAASATPAAAARTGGGSSRSAAATQPVETVCDGSGGGGGPTARHCHGCPPAPPGGNGPAGVPARQWRPRPTRGADRQPGGGDKGRHGQRLASSTPAVVQVRRLAVTGGRARRHGDGGRGGRRTGTVQVGG
eukprot:TRINITY_DN7404_c0_g1_i1.p3 TRINITY_DN7404_c0_g1~~TRINITY_DN7404_c0_g1_i1.p3  ORF type:complete len:165 (-),score=27.17 TRINITY_DN7404_c0_g1_i1:27-521(-)